jgi:tetraprenyl-beta-curcumene synthase
MVGMKLLRIPSLRDLLALIAANIDYWLTVAPTARGELQHWQHCAQSIPDPVLREQALKKLSSESLNSEGATIFALLAPRASRRRLIRLIVAYQVMYDYLDAVNEEPAFSPLDYGLQLHRALLDTMQSRQTSTDYYANHIKHDDGGYLNALVGTCRDTLSTLPFKEAITPTLAVAIKRCGEAQAQNHASAVEGHDQLIQWSEQQAPDSKYLWWELTAAGVSSLAIHALLAAAATPKMTSHEAHSIGAAYFPAVCAISALLDSLIDLARDANTTNHRFATHYTSSGQAAERYAAIIADAEARLNGLRQAQRHKTLLIGVLGYYLSASEARNGFALAVTTRAINAASPAILPILAIMRIRRLKHAAALSRKRLITLRPRD